MSMSKQIEIQCPSCQKAAPFTLWQSINVTVDPWAREQMLAGTFFQFTCPHCGQVAPVHHDCLYHDMDRQLMVYLIVSDEGDPRQSAQAKRGGLAAEFASHFPPSYTTRVVCSTDSLREKVLIDDRHLDDRLVEICKLFLRSRVEADGVQVAAAYYAPGQDESSFVFFTEDGRSGLFPADDLYRQVAEAFGAQLPADDSLTFQLVDAQWALDFMNTLQEQAPPQ